MINREPRTGIDGFDPDPGPDGRSRQDATSDRVPAGGRGRRDSDGGGATLAFAKTCGGDFVGTDEADTITGSPSVDRIAALGGNDTITEPAGVLDDGDWIWGGGGSDTITDVEGETYDHDRIRGEAGNDVIDVDEPGFAGNNHEGDDFVDCGPGKKDKVFADAVDYLVGCEIKRINRRP